MVKAVKSSSGTGPAPADDFLATSAVPLAELLQHLPIGMAVHYEKGIQFANQALCNLLGYTSEQLVGRHILDFIDFDDSLSLFQQFSAVFKKGKPLSVAPLMLLDANDEPRTVQLLVQRVPSPRGATVQIIVQDISHIKAAEYELHRKSQDIASELFRESRMRKVQRDFVSVISHEFRTPLTIINGAAQMISKAVELKKYDKVDEKIQKIRRAVDRTNMLINDILASSTADQNKFKIYPEPLDLAAIISERAEALEESSAQHQIYCDFGCLPPTIIADRKACIHIVENLLSNAVKYSPEANLIEIRGWKEADNVVVSFRDFGVGVASNEVSRLFDQYFRASTSHGIAGTGIGLNLVQKLVELQGGTIAVESLIGEGTTFTVTLPIGGQKPAPEA